MKKYSSIFAGIFILSLLAIPVSAQDMTPDEMTAKALELAQPGPEHERLYHLEGTWETEAKMWSDPAAEPIVTRGASVYAKILGGRFVQVSSTGELYGEQVESLNFLGFDRRYDKYTLYAMDTMGTYSVSARGDYDPAKKRYTLKGSFMEPVTKQTMNYTFLLTIHSEDHHTYELMFDMPTGPFTLMRSDVNRVK